MSTSLNFPLRLENIQKKIKIKMGVSYITVGEEMCFHVLCLKCLWVEAQQIYWIMEIELNPLYFIFYTMIALWVMFIFTAFTGWNRWWRLSYKECVYDCNIVCASVGSLDVDSLPELCWQNALQAVLGAQTPDAHSGIISQQVSWLTHICHTLKKAVLSCSEGYWLCCQEAWVSHPNYTKLFLFSFLALNMWILVFLAKFCQVFMWVEWMWLP